MGHPVFVRSKGLFFSPMKILKLSVGIFFQLGSFKIIIHMGAYAFLSSFSILPQTIRRKFNASSFYYYRKGQCRTRVSIIIGKFEIIVHETTKVSVFFWLIVMKLCNLWKENVVGRINFVNLLFFIKNKLYVCRRCCLSFLWNTEPRR